MPKKAVAKKAAKKATAPAENLQQQVADLQAAVALLGAQLEALSDRTLADPRKRLGVAAKEVAARELPKEVNTPSDVEEIVIIITERRTGVRGITSDTEFANDLDLTPMATKGLFIPIRDAIIRRGRQINNFSSEDFASNDTVGEASEALAGAIPGLEEE